MKKLYTITLLCMVTLFSAQDLDRFRKLLQQGEHSPAATKALFDDSRKSYDSGGKPISLAFFALGNFLMAKHASNPITQYSYFNKGKKALSDAVKKDPRNLEIRLMRYMCQDQSPAALGYKDDLVNDKKFILTEVKNSSDAYLIRRIKTYFKI